MISNLTQRENQIAQMIAEKCLTNGEIGQCLFISEKTVANHVQRIGDKVGRSPSRRNNVRLYICRAWWMAKMENGNDGS